MVAASNVWLALCAAVLPGCLAPAGVQGGCLGRPVCKGCQPVKQCMAFDNKPLTSMMDVKWQVDRPTGGGSYLCQVPGGFKLQRGRMLPFPRVQEAPIMVVSLLTLH